MTKFKVDVNADSSAPVNEDKEKPSVQNNDEFSSKAVTIGAVVVGAALFEAALIPGIIIGAAATLAPKYLPDVEKRLQPLFNSTVRGIYKLGRKTRSAIGEAQERMGDIAAEVQAEEVANAVDGDKA